jgi:integrase
MVELQRLIGARSTEMCMMIGSNIVARECPVWMYIIDPNQIAREEGSPRLANLHKTAHIERADGNAEVKILPIGPRAQAILKPWLRDNPDEFLFQPCEARAAQYARRRKDRKTPLWQSHVDAQARKKKETPKRAPRDHYDRHSYGHAVKRAAQKAGVPHWHPHQLKHTCSTDVRKNFGAEAAQVFVGHSKLSTTEIYAERDWQKIEQIALQMG